MDANTENKRQMVKETGNLACAKAASDAVHKGVWHNDQHLGNILVTEPEVKDGSVKSIELIDYGEINNYLVYDDGRNPDHESKFAGIFGKVNCDVNCRKKAFVLVYTFAHYILFKDFTKIAVSITSHP
ncbi:hypothetical protein GGU11DRAFT_756713 [Lentinula aff. detonsa]|nr:hypothetical protein GGU11DRAFT_756713 [Lentinula aff. detonsa]